MARFFFNVDGEEPDTKGLELATIADAKCMAVRFAGALICDKANSFWDTCDFGVNVTDENGLLLLRLSFTGVEAPAIRRFG